MRAARLAGAALSASLLLACGCVSQRVIDVSRDHTEIRIVNGNDVFIGDERVNPAELPERLEACGIPRDEVIYFKVDGSVRRDLRGAGLRDGAHLNREDGGAAFGDLRRADVLRMILNKGGYTRSVLVSDRYADSGKVPAGYGRRMRSPGGVRTR